MPDTPAPWPPFVERLLLEQPLPAYRLLEPVGARDRVAVFKAEDRRLERTVALKVMAPARPPDGDAVERFFDAARAVARVREPRLVRALDVGRAGGLFFYASQWMKGESLAARMARRANARWPDRDTLPVARDAARALQTMFEQGLTHGRLGPGNLFFHETDDEKMWVLGDVGCATDIAYGGAPEAARAAPDYAAPESIENELVVDGRADLYALGALWHRLVMGEAPFPPGENGTADDVLRQHRERDVEPPRARDPRISAATSKLIVWLMQKDRDERPRTPQEFLNRFRHHALLAEVDGDGDGEPEGGDPDHRPRE